MPQFGWDPEELAVADEFMTHARALREERAAAVKEGRQPQITSLLQQWGGATIVYRRELTASPSYTLNHEEVEKGMQEGIAFAECLTPQAVEVDASGNAVALTLAKTNQSGARRNSHSAGASYSCRCRYPAQHRYRARGSGQFPAKRQIFPGF